jgi:LmbE family N-acetylglucosaminyl deacetylase
MASLEAMPRFFLRAGVLVLLLASPLAGQILPPPHDSGATGLGLALRRLGVSGGVLCVTAHPDDENNAMLVLLSRGRGIPTAVLTLTRGDGGQNEIGTELFEALGVLRTEELMAVHRYDGAAQFFTRAYEFGYSFSVEETFQKWGREETLRDVVRVVRAQRPDVMLTLPLEASGGGQHHQAAARLAKEAFRAAADPARFPEQIAEGLRPWQARKIYQGGTGGGNDASGNAPVSVSTAGYDPLLGATVAEFGSLARASHRCQDVRRFKSPPGEGRALHYLIDAEPAVRGPETDILDGVDTSLGGLARFSGGLGPSLAAIEDAARRARAAFDASAPQRTLPPLRDGLRAVRALIARVRESPASDAGRYEVLHRLAGEEADFEQALTLAHGLALEPIVEDKDAVPGQTVKVTTRVFNPGPEPLPIEELSLEAPPGWTVALESGAPRTLAAGEALVAVHAVTVGADARPSQPYWKRNPKVDRYDLEVPEHQTLPWSPPDVVAALRYASGDVRATLRRPVYARFVGRSVGERQKVLNVVPALSVHLSPAIAVFPRATLDAQRELRVLVRNETPGAGAAVVRVEAPAGFTIEPKEARLSFRYEGEEQSARFWARAPASLAPDPTPIRALAEREGRVYREGYQVINYDHIQERHLYHPAAATVLPLDVVVGKDVRVGYVRGAGDEAPEALAQLGVPVVFLEAEDLGFGDLSRFTTIVTGIRAYQTRSDLRAHHHRLLEYVRGGGHLVVQYNKFEFNAGQGDSPFAPYPARVTGSRVTAEDAPVTLLVPGHPLLTTPNRLGPADFAGWVQERGLYFLEARDPRYTDLLASSDPFPLNAGPKKGLLVEAAVGRGTWTYVGLGLFRQLPAGTPGAYRLLANLVSRPRGR